MPLHCRHGRWLEGQFLAAWQYDNRTRTIVPVGDVAPDEDSLLSFCYRSGI
jgi:hypothetical protein